VYHRTTFGISKSACIRSELKSPRYYDRAWRFDHIQQKVKIRSISDSSRSKGIRIRRRNGSVTAAASTVNTCAAVVVIAEVACGMFAAAAIVVVLDEKSDFGIPC
jgi:hypothetical protein